MPHPPLFRWTLAPEPWDAFVRAARARLPASRLALRDASAADRTVVVAPDALQVGGERVDLTHFHVHHVTDHGTWLELREADPDHRALALPLPPGDTALAATLLDHFGAIAAQHTLDAALLAQRAEAERRRPTWSNRALWFVERHFVACLLALFFVVLPLAAMLAAWVVDG